MFREDEKAVQADKGVEVFALENIVVVSGGSEFEDFVEAAFDAKNHGAFSSAFHRLKLGLTPLNIIFKGSVKLSVKSFQVNFRLLLFFF